MFGVGGHACLGWQRHPLWEGVGHRNLGHVLSWASRMFSPGLSTFPSGTPRATQVNMAVLPGGLNKDRGHWTNRGWGAGGEAEGRAVLGQGVDGTVRPCVLSPPALPLPHAGSHAGRGSPGPSPPGLRTHQQDAPCHALDTGARPTGSTDIDAPVLDRPFRNHEVPGAQDLDKPPTDGTAICGEAGGQGWERAKG